MDRFLFLGAGMIIGAVMMSGRYKRQLLELKVLASKAPPSA